MQNEGTNKFYIHICLNNIQIRHNSQFKDIYFSFLHKQKFHFTSAISLKTSYINDDILLFLETEEQIPKFLKLQRWQNHMILFQHKIDVSELKTRKSTKKRVQTRFNEIISLTITIENEQDIRILDLKVNKICQHYLCISQMTLCTKSSSQQQSQASYFQINTKQQKYIFPITNSQILIQIPNEIQFYHYQNGQLYGKSQWISSHFIQSNLLEIQLYDEKQKYKNKLVLKVKWYSNLSYKKEQSNVLFEAHEVCIYDVQVKFENYTQLANAKLKVLSGPKAFQLNGQLDNRVVNFQRIIYLILKSDQQQIYIICEKNNKIIAEARFHAFQVVSHKVSLIKKQMTDILSHRPVGSIKFLCQKAKNFSFNSANSTIKQNKKKSSSKITLQIQQLSVNYKEDKQLMAQIKTQKQQFYIHPIINFQYFELQTNIHEPLSLTLPQKGSIYMLIKQKVIQQTSGNTQFIGIASINHEQLRLGSNSVNIPFYKNQQKMLQANCVITKILPYPFVKGFYQAQVALSPYLKTMSININIKKVQFEQYFQTYQYQRKQQVYCIVQISKIKKVVILQQQNEENFIFNLTNHSDTLNFTFNQSQYIKGKFIFLVSQHGKQQEIYGTLSFRNKRNDLINNQIEIFNNLEIKNDFAITVGFLTFQLKKGIFNSSQVLSNNKEMRKIKLDMVKVNQSIQKMEKNMSKNRSPTIQSKKLIKQLPVRYASKRKITEQLKLPKI